jgi:hypothetical protein
VPVSDFFRKAGQVWSQADRATGGWLPGGGTPNPLIDSTKRKVQTAINTAGLDAIGAISDRPAVYNAVTPIFRGITRQSEGDPMDPAGKRVAMNLLQRFVSGRGMSGFVVTPEEGRSLYNAFTTDVEPVKTQGQTDETHKGQTSDVATRENTAAGFKPMRVKNYSSDSAFWGFGRHWQTSPANDGSIIVKDQFDDVFEKTGNNASNLKRENIQDVLLHGDISGLSAIEGAKNKAIPLRWQIWPDGRVKYLN